MLSEVTWEALQHYKELIVNCLDIFSFLLVTPEILRITKPTLQSGSIFIYTIVFALIVLSGVTAMTFVIVLMVGQGSTPGLFAWLAAMYLGVLGFGGLMVAPLGNVTAKRMQWIAAHALLVGAGLFVFARTYSLTIVAHQLFVGSPT
jgi:hypothetical protein